MCRDCTVVCRRYAVTIWSRCTSSRIRRPICIAAISKLDGATIDIVICPRSVAATIRIYIGTRLSPTSIGVISRACLRSIARVRCNTIAITPVNFCALGSRRTIRPSPSLTSVAILSACRRGAAIRSGLTVGEAIRLGSSASTRRGNPAAVRIAALTQVQVHTAVVAVVQARSSGIGLSTPNIGAWWVVTVFNTRFCRS